jgi:hypothetical protein
MEYHETTSIVSCHNFELLLPIGITMHKIQSYYQYSLSDVLHQGIPQQPDTWQISDLIAFFFGYFVFKN